MELKPNFLIGPKSAEDLYVVELDERLEFGAAIVDSDLQADTNTGCSNNNCSSNGFVCGNYGGCDNVDCHNGGPCS
jgi:hypothetical protein